MEINNSILNLVFKKVSTKLNGTTKNQFNLTFYLLLFNKMHVLVLVGK
jgi:hypothetical protein